MIGRGKMDLLKKILNFNNIKFRERWEKGFFKGIRDFSLHLGINFNPEVSFESVIYCWKALSGLFLLDLFRT